MMVHIFAILPTVFLSWCTYLVSRITRPAFVKNVFIKLLVKLYNINTSEIEKDVFDYSCLGDFFIRRLKSDARPVAGDENTVVSPVDGRIVICGSVNEDTVLTVKGSAYSIEDLIGDRDTAEQFRQGSFAVIHLRPFDYHRIHMPCTGRLTGHGFFRGRLLPVHEKGLRAFKNLYIQNKRRITVCKGKCGTFALIKVGAFNVGRIPVEYDIPENPSGFSPISSGKEFQKGEEIARFELGSTVILLFEKDGVKLEDLKENQEVKMGEKIGRIKDYRPSD
ncbi:archaetidylserine decarboxylase [Planctomycetota bacterium]